MDHKSVKGIARYDFFDNFAKHKIAVKNANSVIFPLRQPSVDVSHGWTLASPSLTFSSVILKKNTVKHY